MLTRLEPLSQPTQRVLRVLAAAGRRVDYELIAATSGLAEDELAEALREAVAAQVLVPLVDDSAYEFRHALLRETAYAELLPGERERLHAELAGELESHSQGGVRSRCTRSSPITGTPRASRTGRCRRRSAPARRRRASTRIRRRCGIFQRALELWDRVAPATRDGLDLIELTACAATAARMAGEHELAVALSSRAIESARRRAGSRCAAAVLHARLAQSLMEAGRGARRRRALRAGCRAAAAAGRRRSAPRVLDAHARTLLLEARLEEARGPIDEAVAIARTLGLRDVEAQALATRTSSACTGAPRRRWPLGEAALRAARAAGEPETLVRAHVNAAEALEQAGRLGEAIELALEGVQAARRAGAERVLGAHLKSDVAHRLIKLGRFDEAEAMIEDALRAAPSGTASVSLHHNAALIAAHRGDADRHRERGPDRAGSCAGRRRRDVERARRRGAGGDRALARRRRSAPGRSSRRRSRASRTPSSCSTRRRCTRSAHGRRPTVRCATARCVATARPSRRAPR